MLQPTRLFLALLSLLLPAAAFAQTGTISGVVTTAVAPLRPLRVTADMQVCGRQLPDEAITVGADGGLANVVLTLTGVKVRTPYPEPQIVNEHCRFAPRVQLARPGAPANTSSKDPLLHTTNAQQDGGRTLFNVGLPVPNLVVSRPLNGPGLVRLTCNTHTWMRGFIVVTDEMGTTSGADGHFQLNGVPAGTYELKVWHEMLKAPPVKVTVTAGGTANVKIALTR